MNIDNVENWGCLDYQEAHGRQKLYVEELADGKRDEVIVLCSHPPVVTLGRKTLKSDIIDWQGPIYQTDRGGQATYHGPGQVVCYPLINLKKRGQNIAGLLNALENAAIDALRTYGLECEGNPQRDHPQKTGLWAGRKKMASIGLALKRWISYHGLALNLYKDSLAFKGINPCGLNPETMGSLEEIMGVKIERKDFEDIFIERFLLYLPRERPLTTGH